MTLCFSSCSVQRLAVTLLVVASSAVAWTPPNRSSSSGHGIQRRSALEKMVSVATGAVSIGALPLKKPALAQPPLSTTANVMPSASSFDAYYITPDETNVRSKLDKIDSNRFLQRIASSKAGGSVWLGEHHNSAADHNFQATFIREIHKHRNGKKSSASTMSAANNNNKMAIGLEQVQQVFQPVLDDFVSGKVSLEQMKFMVQWEKRWTWNFDNYKHIFEAARELKIPLLALNVDSEDLSLVEKQGYPGLPTERLRKYIRDPKGFSDFALQSEFKSYVDYVIQPSYELHQRMGLLKYTMNGELMEEEMTFRRFLSARILWDEGMTSTAFDWCSKNPGGLLVGLVGADHVKFKNGIPGRFSRMAAKANSMDCTSVVINPTLIDSRPSGTVASIPTSDSSQYPERITLQLRYVKSPGKDTDPESGLSAEGREGVLPFSDYVVLT